MDDSRFDDIIKRKVSEYEEAGFDAGALDALHRQLGSVHVSPWYSRYHSELLIGAGFTVSTFLILLALWFLNNQKTEAWNKNVRLIEFQQEQITQLKGQLDDLEKPPADTVYIREESMPVQTLLNKISELELIIRNLGTQSDHDSYAARSFDIPVSTTLTPAIFFPNEKTPITLQVNDGLTSAPKNEARPTTPPGQDQTEPFSVKTFRSLEKHYRKGVGIRIGPALDFSKGLYETGQGRIDYAGGLLGDFILSPSLSIETGAKFIHRFYKLREGDLSTPDIRLPDINPDLEPVISADVDAWMLEIPVSLKYRMPLSMKSHWLAGIGYSSQTVTKQIFEYEYELEGNSSVRINESIGYTRTKIYPGTLNISLGISNQLKNKKIIESSLYYQHGLGDTGIEKMRSNFIGLRAAYWFTLR